jgi:ketosteroid isomerase-like protein
MSERNVEIVRQMYDAMNRGEFPDAMLDLLDPRIAYVNPPDAVEPGVRHGLPAFRRAVAKLFEGWESWRAQPEDLQADGDRVAVVVRYRAVGRGSGLEVDGRESALWTLRDGKVVRYEWFHGPDDALTALGAEG